jgi:hypothetical protein
MNLLNIQMIVVVFRGSSYHWFINPFDLFATFCFRSSNYPRFIASSMEAFELILSLSNGTFDLFLALCFKGSNYPKFIISSMEPFELILGLSNGPFDLNTCITL